jgi:hypothetical protein
MYGYLKFNCGYAEDIRPACATHTPVVFSAYTMNTANMFSKLGESTMYGNNFNSLLILSHYNIQVFSNPATLEAS